MSAIYIVFTMLKPKASMDSKLLKYASIFASTIIVMKITTKK